MFTGIIEGLGTVESIDYTNDSARVTIDAGSLVADLELGGSLAVNGVCLTSTRQAASTEQATSAKLSASTEQATPTNPAASANPATPTNPAASANPGHFTAEVMGETLRLTGLGTLKTGDRVNLERCTPASGRFDGHVVQGHVDGRGELIDRIDRADWSTLRIAIPADLAPLTAVKGSIALNGVSLTLTAVSEPDAPTAWVEVGLIPATLTHTTFGELEIGAAVNVEVDVLAKYTARLLSFGPTSANSSSSTHNSTQQGVDHD